MSEGNVNQIADARPNGNHGKTPDPPAASVGGKPAPATPMVSSNGNLSRGNPPRFRPGELALARFLQNRRVYQLAAEIGASSSTLSRVLSGKAMPAARLGLALCHALGVPVELVYPDGVPPLRSVGDLRTCTGRRLAAREGAAE